MLPELAKAFNVSALEVSGILGTYYYTYSTASLVAGVLLDRLGAKYIEPGKCTSCYCYDPDGNIVEMQEIIPGTPMRPAFGFPQEAPSA